MSKALFILLISLGLLSFILGLLYIIELVQKTRQFREALSQWGKLRGINCLTQPTNSLCQEILTLSVSFPDPRRPFSPNFDSSAALFAANICQRLIVYIGSKQSTALTLPGFTKYALVPLPSEPAAVIWTNDSNQCAISFHGTISLTEFHTDLDYTQISINNYRVHEGFYKKYSQIQASLRALIPSTTTQIFLAGHSLGAALSFLAASELATDPKLSVEVWGSAPPRVGDQAFVSHLSAHARCNSLLNLADLIPSLPWSYMPNFSNPPAINSFAHVPSLNIFNNLKGDLLSCHLLPAYYEAIKAGSVTKLS